jgi:PiT family inorganic phosphate transporter
VAGNIVAAWIVTLPAAAAIGAVAYAVTRLFGTGAAGPLIVSLLIVSGSALLFLRRAQRGPAVAPVEAS